MMTLTRFEEWRTRSVVLSYDEWRRDHLLLLPKSRLGSETLDISMNPCLVFQFSKKGGSSGWFPDHRARCVQFARNLWWATVPREIYKLIDTEMAHFDEKRAI